MKNIFFMILILVNVSHAKMSETQKRELEVKAWVAAEKAAKVLSMPLKGMLSVTGCHEDKTVTDACPAYNLKYFKEVNDRSLTSAQVDNLKEKCSPESQGFPQKSLNNPSDNLTKDCAALLNKLIPWKENLLSENVNTEAEKNLKKAFRKGIWGALFLHRTIPATYSENGSYCPSLEQEFFGASSNGEYSFEKWVKGELIQTEILDAMRTIGTQVGFMDLNTCKKHNPIMYYENDSETLGLCRDGARNLTSKNMVFITSSIIHEMRHSDNLFGTHSSHDSSCVNGNETGCDAGEFGAYGAEAIFADQIIAGSLLIIRDLDGVSPLAKNNMKEIVTDSVDDLLCPSFKKIYNYESPLYDSLIDSGACGSMNDTFLIDNYGFTASEL